MVSWRNQSNGMIYELGEDPLDGWNGSARCEFYALSGDKKPTGAPNGAILYEMDTKKIYLYDAAGRVWREQGA